MTAETHPGSDGAGPLSGIRVLDLTRNLAGPYCTLVLGDLGADVVKIERPDGGDDTRAWSPPTWGGISTMFLAANRNKRSVAVDIDTEAGCEVVRRLSASADILVESFRPGALSRRGLDAAKLRALNPRLIYCSVSGFGSQGPLSQRPAYDPAIQAYTGLMDMTGEPDGRPVRSGTALIDLGTGLLSAIGVLAALRNRDRSGQGSLVEASLYETAAFWLGYHILGYVASGIVPHRVGSATPFIAPYEVFEAADGSLFIAAANDRQFEALAKCIGQPSLAVDPRFQTNADRVNNRQVLAEAINAAVLRQDRATWEAALTEAGVACTPVRTVADLVDDVQLNTLGLFEHFDHDVIEDLRLVGQPFRLGGARGAHRGAPPHLGQHTYEVLASVGFEASAIQDLEAAGVVHLHRAEGIGYTH